ncbi:ABC1 atypical kinase-like domain, partial [Dillenia turbinata]
MAARLLLRAGKSLALAGTAVGGGGAAVAIATSDDPQSTLKLFTNVPLRLFRNSVTAAAIAFVRVANVMSSDYEYSLWGLPEGSVERAKVKHEVHLRSARRLQELCFKNGGIYIKLGQHIGQLVFDEFDPVPLASASLAQVHVARTRDGQKVAVKVQHTHLTDTAAADYATVGLIVNTLHWLFPSFDYRWLLDEVRESELDFLTEAKNNEKCLENFQKLSPHVAGYVYAPRVYWKLSTSKLLTMEFIDGVQVNDVKAIQRLGLQPSEVAKLVSQAFAEMIYKHGFVHCDPHAANLMIRPLPSSSRSIFGKRKPQLILLDHGLYRELEPPMRINYAALWKGLVFADAKAIKENSVKLGAGDDLYALFAGVLTMRPWNRVVDPAIDHLVLEGNDNDRSELQMFASQYFSEISELLSRLPRVILLMLKTNDCLRSVNHALGSSLETFLIIGRVSSEAILKAKMLENKSLLRSINIWLEEVLLEARFLGMQMILWLLHLRRALYWS